MTRPHAARCVFFLHLVFVAIAVGGGFGVLLSPWWLLLHLPVVIWSAAINIAGGTCPLTPLESRLRGEAAPAGLDDGFLAHYVGPLLCPGATPRQLEGKVGVFIVAWNLLVYAFVWWWLRGH
ncbi:MAG: DUF2784 domain-containing protein [Betaproteobacteria bacterium]|nr:DUF2784 domain-containing protein [Betaproteobacteria bacterium]